MCQLPVNVTYSIEEILKDITQKLEKLDDKVDQKKIIEFYRYGSREVPPRLSVNTDSVKINDCPVKP